MVKLKNIKRISNTMIECDLLPEDSKEIGHMLVDISKRKVVNYDLPKGYEWCTNHVAHAMRTLLDMVENNHVVQEEKIVWC